MADEDFEKPSPSSDAPDTDQEPVSEGVAPRPLLHSSALEPRSANRPTQPGIANAPPAHRLSQTAQSALSPFPRAESVAEHAGNLSVNVTQESVALSGDEVDRHYFLERRVAILEEETAQLNARIRLAEKAVEDARRLAMAACVFTLGALIVAKLLGR